ncbi:MAG: recombinase family protein [Dermatophilaceae bacterium]
MTTAIYLHSAQPGRMNLAGQRGQCKDYAHEHGLVITGGYVDTGHSRDGLNAPLHEAAERNVTDLIVTHLYRLGRHPNSYKQTLAAFRDVGIAPHAISEEAIMANPFLRSLIRRLAAAYDHRAEQPSE